MLLICNDCGALFKANKSNNKECPECGGEIAFEYESEGSIDPKDLTASKLMEIMYGINRSKGKYN